MLIVYRWRATFQWIYCNKVIIIIIIIVAHLRKHDNYRQIVKKFSTMSFWSVFKTIVTFWRAKNKKSVFLS